MVDLGLEREMRRVLMDLEMTSNGVTTSYDSSGGGAFASKPPVSGGCDLRTDPPHVYWRRRWNEAEDDDRRRVLDRAKEELRAIRQPPPPRPEETEAEREKRLLADGEGWRAEEVALTFRMTPTAVRRVRSRHGRDPERGLVDPMQPMPDATPEERRERALLLHREHRMSYRAIGILLGVSHETIRRDVMAATMASGKKAA